MKAIAIIPARLASTRLPRKVLREVAGVPMVGRVYAAARAANGLADVLIATDSDEVFSLCRERGWNACMTSVRHRSGTERVHEVAQAMAADVYINVQGDEPLARPEHLTALLALMARPEVQVGTLKTRAGDKDVFNPNAVKVVTDVSGRALYFSRAAIPHDRDGTGGLYHWKHLGFYAYRKPALDRFVELPESALERTERLEQLRFLENGMGIHVAETLHDTIGVDTEEDLRRVEAVWMRAPAL
jgi:3-deoxy-manno-octulosonate cytidylyltransferase (CMP-KDO synthetase)